MAALLSMDGALFTELVEQLAMRGRGTRESGAFLLADRKVPDGRRPQPVTAIAYYDDLDPGCLTGAINFTADGFTALAALCRRAELRVVADIHTHPKGRVAQSPIDAAHPMVALDGHVAIIAPRYAAGAVSPADLGVHVRQDGTWTSLYRADAADALQVLRERPTLWARLIGRAKNLLHYKESR